MADLVVVPEIETPVAVIKVSAAKADPTPEPVAVPEHVETITVEAFARTQSVYPAPVVRAFVAIEKTNFVVRKLSTDEWQQLFGEFLTTERR